uniref:Uncharacterized protein n=1 Tax=viral metagenome TaxID=1070528 RepID=A0A6C0BCZ5_9ZZZZ
MSLFTLRKRSVKNTNNLESRLNKTELQNSFYQKQISKQLEELIDNIKHQKQNSTSLENSEYRNVIHNGNKALLKSNYSLNDVTYNYDINKDTIRLGNNGILTTIPTNIKMLSIVNNICMDADIPIQSDNKIEHIEIIKPNTIDEGIRLTNTVLENTVLEKSLPITSIPVTTTDTIIEQIQTISDNNTSINKYTRIVYIKTTKIFLLFIIFIGVIIVLMSKNNR